jgi:hypothetical protein
MELLFQSEGCGLCHGQLIAQILDLEFVTLMQSFGFMENAIDLFNPPLVVLLEPLLGRIELL